jgi:hypothetical protein
MSLIRWYQKQESIKVGLLKIEEKSYSSAMRSAGWMTENR